MKYYIEFQSHMIFSVLPYINTMLYVDTWLGRCSLVFLHFKMIILTTYIASNHVSTTIRLNFMVRYIRSARLPTLSSSKTSIQSMGNKRLQAMSINSKRLPDYTE